MLPVTIIQISRRTTISNKCVVILWNFRIIYLEKNGNEYGAYDYVSTNYI